MGAETAPSIDSMLGLECAPLTATASTTAPYEAATFKPPLTGQRRQCRRATSPECQRPRRPWTQTPFARRSSAAARPSTEWARRAPAGASSCPRRPRAPCKMWQRAPPCHLSVSRHARCCRKSRGPPAGRRQRPEARVEATPSPTIKAPRPAQAQRPYRHVADVDDHDAHTAAVAAVGRHGLETGHIAGGVAEDAVGQRRARALCVGVCVCVWRGRSRSARGQAETTLVAFAAPTNVRHTDVAVLFKKKVRCVRKHLAVDRA